MTKKYKLETISASKLIPYINNSRTHSDEQVAQIAASIKEFGFTNPVLIDEDGGIIAGHGRLRAAKLLELETVPCIRLEGLTTAQKKAYIIADNKLSLNAAWDDDMLRLELDSLAELGFDLDLTGFDEGEITNLFLEREHGETDPDAEWAGMPEFNQEDKTAFRSLTVHFKDQNDVDEFARVTQQTITEKTKYFWFPEIEIERYANKEYQNE